MNFSTTSAVALTGAVVITGEWAKGRTITPRIAVGLTVLAVFLAAIGEASPKLGQQFALLILAAAVFTYGVAIARKLGYAK